MQHSGDSSFVNGVELFMDGAAAQIQLTTNLIKKELNYETAIESLANRQ